MNNPSPNYAVCQKCGRTLTWVHSIDGAGSYCQECSEETEAGAHPNRYTGYCCYCRSFVHYLASRSHPVKDRRHKDTVTYHPSLEYSGSYCMGRIVPAGGRKLFRQMPVPKRWDNSQDKWRYQTGYEHGYRGLIKVAWLATGSSYQAGYVAGTGDGIALLDVPR